MVKKRWGMRVKRGIGVGPFWGRNRLTFYCSMPQPQGRSKGGRIKTAPPERNTMILVIRRKYKNVFYSDMGYDKKDILYLKPNKKAGYL